MDSLLLGSENDEPSVPESVLQNLLLQVQSLFCMQTLTRTLGYMRTASQQPEPELKDKEAENKPLYQFVIPEPGMRRLHCCVCHECALIHRILCEDKIRQGGEGFHQCLQV